jgi:hypothetical protein
MARAVVTLTATCLSMTHHPIPPPCHVHNLPELRTLIVFLLQWFQTVKLKPQSWDDCQQCNDSFNMKTAHWDSWRNTIHPVVTVIWSKIYNFWQQIQVSASKYWLQKKVERWGVTIWEVLVPAPLHLNMITWLQFLKAIRLVQIMCRCVQGRSSQSLPLHSLLHHYWP